MKLKHLIEKIEDDDKKEDDRLLQKLKTQRLKIKWLTKRLGKNEKKSKESKNYRKNLHKPDGKEEDETGENADLKA